MKLFDRINDEEDEVELSAPGQEEDEFGEESRLKEEVEETIIGSGSSSGESSTAASESSTGSSSGSGSMLPGMGSGTESSSTSSGTTRGGSSSGTDMDDLRRQNEKIIGLLKEIRSEVKNENELL